MNKRKIVVTSALPYANGDIHLGHLVEYLQTDFWVRYQKLRGNDCVYVCADDTHGTPVMIRARKEGVSPEDLIARMHAIHLKDFTDFQVAFDNYYTTNSPENKAFSEQIFAAMEKSGGITKKTSPQLYCEHCRMFLPDRFVKGVCPKCGAEGQYGDSCDHCGSTYGAEELGSPKCTTCGGTPVVKDSEHLYFELEPQHDFLEKWIPGHTTSDVSNKLLEWFKEPLRGWCISRDAPYFGFEIPGHPGKFFYVWVDAPIGYIASLSNWCAARGEKLEDWWNNPDAELYHFIGKDIIRFHCLFWPGMLHSAGFKTPTKVFVHGFLTVNGEKMSKSKGTFVNARTYLDHLPASALRYYYADFDGLHEYCFHTAENAWNDFSYRGPYSQFQFVYLTYDGLISTLAWEGVREALDLTLRSLPNGTGDAEDDPMFGCIHLFFTIASEGEMPEEEVHGYIGRILDILPGIDGTTSVGILSMCAETVRGRECAVRDRIVSEYERLKAAEPVRPEGASEILTVRDSPKRFILLYR